MAFTDVSQSAGADYAVAWRDTQGGNPVRLGKGFPVSVSPDSRWIASSIPSTGQTLLYPTGPGEPVAVPGLVLGPGVLVADWFSDSTHVLLCGAQGSAAPRCYRVEARAGAALEPMTPEGVVAAALGSDDRTLLLQMKDRTFRRSTIGGDLGTPVESIRASDIVLALSRDLKSVYVKTRTVPAHIERIEFATGTRSAVKTIGPAESTGVVGVDIWDWQENGGYAYSFSKELSQLFVVSGIRK